MADRGNTDPHHRCQNVLLVQFLTGNECLADRGNTYPHHRCQNVLLVQFLTGMSSSRTTVPARGNSFHNHTTEGKVSSWFNSWQVSYKLEHLWLPVGCHSYPHKEVKVFSYFNSWQVSHQRQQLCPQDISPVYPHIRKQDVLLVQILAGL